MEHGNIHHTRSRCMRSVTAWHRFHRRSIFQTTLRTRLKLSRVHERKNSVATLQNVWNSSRPADLVCSSTLMTKVCSAFWSPCAYWTVAKVVRHQFIFYQLLLSTLKCRGCQSNLSSVWLFKLFLCIWAHHTNICQCWCLENFNCHLTGRKGNIENTVSVLQYSVYFYSGAQRYEHFLQIGRLYQALILLGSAVCLPRTSVCLVQLSVFRVPVCLRCSWCYIYIYTFKNFWLTSFSLSFSELSLVGLALNLVD